MTILKDYQIRVLANACITRYDRGEKDIIAIINSYNLTEDNKTLVLAQIYAYRPDIQQSTITE